MACHQRTPSSRSIRPDSHNNAHLLLLEPQYKVFSNPGKKGTHHNAKIFYNFVQDGNGTMYDLYLEILPDIAGMILN